MIVVSVLGGCTSGSSSPEPDGSERVEPQPTAKFLADVNARTEAATSASYSWELRARDGVVLVREQGTFDRVRQRLASETVSMGDGGPSAPLRVVVDGDAVYLQPGFVAEALGLDPEDWIGTPSADHDLGREAVAGTSPSGASPPAAIGPRGIGAAGLLGSVLADAPGEVVIVGEIGEARVRGEPTTQLRTQVAGPPSAAADAAVDVWVDGAGRLRRLEVRPSPPEAGTGDETRPADEQRSPVGDDRRPVGDEIVLHVELYDYDQPVDLGAVVDVPDDDQITATNAELLEQLVGPFAAG